MTVRVGIDGPRVVGERVAEIPALRLDLDQDAERSELTA